MKRYTQVTIIRLDTGASGMYRIPASGGKHLGNTVLPPPASLSYFSLPHLYIFLSSIQSTRISILIDLQYHVHCMLVSPNKDMWRTV